MPAYIQDHDVAPFNLVERFQHETQLFNGRVIDLVALEGGAKGVTSNCVNPAYVRTPLVERQITDQARTHGIEESEVVEDVMLAPVAVKRLVEPEEVASLVLFLCGPASASVNGASLTMDGGWTAH